MAATFENYEISRSKHEDTGLRLFLLKDKQWGVDGTYVEFNQDFDVHAGIAYIGAKTSRSTEHTDEIFQTVHAASQTKDGFSGDRLAGIFSGYGHASVADMAPVMMFFDHLPMHLAYRLFNSTSVGGGQELSTRYVRLDDFGLPTFSQIIGHDTEGAREVGDDIVWHQLQQHMAMLYNKWYGVFHQSLRVYLSKTYKGDVKPSTLDSRTLDAVRMFLPFGTETRQAFLGSARNWIDIASQLRSSSDVQARAFGNHIVALLSLSDSEECGDIQAHLNGLTKYSEGSGDLASRISKFAELLEREVPGGRIDTDPALASPSKITSLVLPVTDRGSTHTFHRPMTPGETVVASYVGAALPNLSGNNINMVTGWVAREGLARDISSLIFDGHTHHNLMRSQADIRGIPLWYESALAFHRDINRQRALGRHALIFSDGAAPYVLDTGFNDNFTIKNSEYWSGRYDAWKKDMEGLYDQLNSFVSYVETAYGSTAAESAAMNLMPLGTQTTMLLSGPPSQWNYMTSLRVALGGDFGYRQDVWNMLETIRHQDPYFQSMASHLVQPDVNDPEQIVGRS